MALPWHTVAARASGLLNTCVQDPCVQVQETCQPLSVGEFVNALVDKLDQRQHDGRRVELCACELTACENAHGPLILFGVRATKDHVVCLTQLHSAAHQFGDLGWQLEPSCAGKSH